MKQLNKQKQEEKLRKKQIMTEKQYRGNANLLHEDIKKTAKVNNWIQSKLQKEMKLN